MDRNKAIEHLKVVLKTCDVQDEEAVEMAIEALSCSEFPNNWIPCSEQSPKKDGRYLVTRYDYVTNTEFIDILWYEKNTWWNRQATGDYAVTAWKPLPELYKGE